ncbi:hypothetical protein Q31b_17820 [Novipirellula aureliae]|uniref:Uncharacterized protein n=1 Tax=Novipirellula aureliae TaxID=2527966 RepID=A0A5C6E9U0_9BACT|nr:hypothetical protein Q31b_17820 [Novipirellula aureliae]
MVCECALLPMQSCQPKVIVDSLHLLLQRNIPPIIFILARKETLFDCSNRIILGGPLSFFRELAWADENAGGYGSFPPKDGRPAPTNRGRRFVGAGRAGRFAFMVAPSGCSEPGQARRKQKGSPVVQVSSNLDAVCCHGAASAMAALGMVEREWVIYSAALVDMCFAM